MKIKNGLFVDHDMHYVFVAIRKHITLPKRAVMDIKVIHRISMIMFPIPFEMDVQNCRATLQEIQDRRWMD